MVDPPPSTAVGEATDRNAKQPRPREPQPAGAGPGVPENCRLLGAGVVWWCQWG